MSDNVYTVKQPTICTISKPDKDTPSADVRQGRHQSYPTLDIWLDGTQKTSYLLGVQTERDRLVESYEEWAEENGSLWSEDSVQQFINWHLGD